MGLSDQQKEKLIQKGIEIGIDLVLDVISEQRAKIRKEAMKRIGEAGERFRKKRPDPIEEW